MQYRVDSDRLCLHGEAGFRGFMKSLEIRRLNANLHSPADSAGVFTCHLMFSLGISHNQQSVISRALYLV